MCRKMKSLEFEMYFQVNFQAHWNRTHTPWRILILHRDASTGSATRAFCFAVRRFT